MANLSPAAASIVQAFDDRYEINMFNVNWQEDCIAAALRAAADQVISSVSPPCEDFNEYDQGFLAAHIKYRDEFLAIADELEAL